MKLILSVFALLTLAFTSGCVVDGPGSLPLPIWYDPSADLRVPKGYKWTDQKVIDGRLNMGTNQTGFVTTYSGLNPNTYKSAEKNYKDGKWHGDIRVWHENGQKLLEGTYKDGKRVSARYWNSKGEEVGTVEDARGYGETPTPRP